MSEIDNDESLSIPPGAEGLSTVMRGAPAPRTSDEKVALVDEARTARRDLAKVSAQVLLLKGQLRSRLVDEARAQNACKLADAALRKEVEGEP